MTGNTWKKILYTIYSPFYDPFVKLLSPKRKKSIDMLDIQANDKVLIIGAGTGLDVPFLPSSAHYTAVDLTPAMLDHFRRKAAKRNLNADCLVMDAHNLAFAASSFDKVILHFIVAVIPDPYQLLREVERVLKPGGTAVIYDKFLADKQKAPWWRKTLNLVTEPLATSITRRLGDLLSVTNLKKIHDEPANLGGAFRIALVRKV